MRTTFLYNQNNIKPVHLAVIKCVEYGYGYTEDIIYILQIINIDRLIVALSDLIEYDVLEINTAYNSLRFTDNFLSLQKDHDILVVTEQGKEYESDYGKVGEYLKRLGIEDKSFRYILKIPIDKEQFENE